MTPLDRRFGLANEPGSLGLSCSNLGVSLAGVPLLRMTTVGFAARPTHEIQALIKSAYGLGDDKIDMSAKLGVVAEALNQGDLGRAMAAALRLRLPDQNGLAELKLQQPLKVTETEDSWLIEGSREYDFDATPPLQSADGPYLVEILKVNCQVVRAYMRGGLPYWED